MQRIGGGGFSSGVEGGEDDDQRCAEQDEAEVTPEQIDREAGVAVDIGGEGDEVEGLQQPNPDPSQHGSGGDPQAADDEPEAEKDHVDLPPGRTEDPHQGDFTAAAHHRHQQ